MIATIIRCLCMCLFEVTDTYDEQQHLLSTSEIPFEIRYHTATPSTYNLLYGFAKRYKRLPRPTENYRKIRLGQWTQQQIALQMAGTLPLLQVRALKYIYDLANVKATYTPFQLHVLSCPTALMEMWVEKETAARFILLWCFTKQFKRFPLAEENYVNFTLGAWYKIIQNDVSFQTRKSLESISQRLIDIEVKEVNVKEEVKEEVKEVKVKVQIKESVKAEPVKIKGDDDDLFYGIIP